MLFRYRVANVEVAWSYCLPGCAIISETSVPAIPEVAKTAASGIWNNPGEIIIWHAARKTTMALPGDVICGW